MGETHLVPQREVEVAVQVAVRHGGGQRRGCLAAGGGEEHRAQGQSGQPAPLGWGAERGRESCGRGVGGTVREREVRERSRGTVRARICHGQEKKGRVAEPFNRHCL